MKGICYTLYTACSHSCAYGLLLFRMASLEHHNKHKVRPLHRAVNSCNKHVIMALLERGVNPNVQDEHRYFKGDMYLKNVIYMYK